MPKLYLYLAIFVIVLGFTARFTWLTNEVPKLNAKLHSSEQVVKDLNLQLENQIKTINAAEERSIIYQNHIQEINDENNNLRNAVANGTKQLHINATCKAAQIRAATDPWRTEDSVPQLDPIATEGYFELAEGIPANAAQYQLAIDTLNYWRDHWTEICPQ